MWSLTTVTHYETKFSDAFTKSSFNNKSINMLFEGVALLKAMCDLPPITDIRRKDCSKLSHYFVPIRDGVGAHVEIPFLPSLKESDYADPQIRKLVANLSMDFEYFNTTSGAKDISGLTANDFREYKILSFVIELLSFAFGVGLMRRALDLYTDW